MLFRATYNNVWLSQNSAHHLGTTKLDNVVLLFIDYSIL